MWLELEGVELAQRLFENEQLRVVDQRAPEPLAASWSCNGLGRRSDARLVHDQLGSYLEQGPTTALRSIDCARPRATRMLMTKTLCKAMGRATPT